MPTGLIGSMGYGMASSLLRAGYPVYGFDVTTAIFERFCNDGGLRDPIEQVLPTIKIAVIVVLNAAQAEAVLFRQSGIVQNIRPGTCVISCATMAPSTACDLATRCAQKNDQYDYQSLNDVFVPRPGKLHPIDKNHE